MTVELRPDVQEWLNQSAAREGVLPEEMAARTLAEKADADRRLEAIHFLRSLRDSDSEDEGDEPWEEIQKRLDHPVVEFHTVFTAEDLAGMD